MLNGQTMNTCLSRVYRNSKGHSFSYAVILDCARRLQPLRYVWPSLCRHTFPNLPQRLKAILGEHIGMTKVMPLRKNSHTCYGFIGLAAFIASSVFFSQPSQTI